jgi:hypothetical protein
MVEDIMGQAYLAFVIFPTFAKLFVSKESLAAYVDNLLEMTIEALKKRS